MKKLEETLGTFGNFKVRILYLSIKDLKDPAKNIRVPFLDVREYKDTKAFKGFTKRGVTFSLSDFLTVRKLYFQWKKAQKK